MELVVGRIGRAHGVHGEVVVDVRTDDPERRFAPGSVLATEMTAGGPLTVARTRRHSGRLLVAFEGVCDRTAAESLRGAVLVVESTTAAPLEDPDDFWDHDLLGLDVVACGGERLGVVGEVVHTPGHELLSVRRPDGTELLVPFLRTFVPEVDLAAGRVVVDPPPGLLDLAAGTLE